MKASTLAWHMQNAEVGYIDRDVLKMCSKPEKWHSVYSSMQLEAALERIPACIHHACIVANLLDNPTVPRLEEAAKGISKALHAAYTGSTEHGSFFRLGNCEYVPSVFLLMKELEEAIAALKR